MPKLSNGHESTDLPNGGELDSCSSVSVTKSKKRKRKHKESEEGDAELPPGDEQVVPAEENCQEEPPKRKKKHKKKDKELAAEMSGTAIEMAAWFYQSDFFMCLFILESSQLRTISVVSVCYHFLRVMLFPLDQSEKYFQQ